MQASISRCDRSVDETIPAEQAERASGSTASAGGPAAGLQEVANQCLHPIRYRQTIAADPLSLDRCAWLTRCDNEPAALLPVRLHKPITSA
jgi:hypothetical protein